jgi:hypothetical protein
MLKKPYILMIVQIININQNQIFIVTKFYFSLNKLASCTCTFIQYVEYNNLQDLLFLNT